jgi:hypothetical protein
VTDWVTISSLATAAGTLVLAVATFASVRSANRSARVAERSLLLGLRPVLVPARTGDPDHKVLYGDGKKFALSAGSAHVEADDGVVYMAISLRNVGTGLAVLQRYDIIPENPLYEPQQTLEPDRRARQELRYRPIPEFREQQRDLYVAPGDTGFWQAALRDPTDPLRESVLESLTGEPEPLSVDLFYGDHEGGQHAVSRFLLIPGEGNKWLASVAFHWTVESPDPRDLDV